jgi:large subunit ribosomal protein L4
MRVEVKNIEGKAISAVELPEDIYGLEMNEHVLHLAVKAYRANKRQGTHMAKTRAFVSGGGKKPFKQKGTGGARQGSERSPNHVGGAVSHGPVPRCYRQKLNAKVRQLALKIALSDKVRNGKMVVVDDFKVSSYKTKHVKGALSSLGVASALLADERKDDLLYKSARNIYKVSTKEPSELNAEDLLKHETFVISVNGLKALHQRFEEKNNAVV